MINFLSRLPQKQKRILLISSSLLLLAALVYGYVEYRLKNLEDTLSSHVAEQEVLLTELLSTTSTPYIHDCAIAERIEFDDLLGSLDQGLSSVELSRLEYLFSLCGSFFADRESLLATTLSREVEVYVSYVEQLQALKTLPADENVQEWQRVAAAETSHAASFVQLVSLQHEIIKALKNGQSVDSDEIRSILEEVQKVQTAMVTSKKESAQASKNLQTD